MIEAMIIGAIGGWIWNKKVEKNSPSKWDEYENYEDCYIVKNNSIHGARCDGCNNLIGRNKEFKMIGNINVSDYVRYEEGGPYWTSDLDNWSNCRYYCWNCYDYE